MIKRIWLVIVANLIYALVFASIFPSVGDAAGSLSLIPDAIAGWFLGARYGVIAGLANFFLNELLYTTFSTTVDTFSIQSLPGLIFSVLSSGLVGMLSDLIYRIRKLTEDLQLEIAQRQQAETALIQARDRAMVASQTKEKLLRSVSHELRTPLNVILGYAELFEEDLIEEGEDSIEEQYEVIRELIKSARYLIGLVNDLLDQARFQEEGVSLQNGEVNLHKLMGEISSKTTLLAEAKGLNFFSKVDELLPPSIVGDSQRLQQVILNLLGNAIKFTHNGHVKLQFDYETEKTWLITIEDTGPGIPKSAQNLIFAPFHQLESDRPQSLKGTGLGLSIVKEIISAMEGEITLHSELNQGSKFVVRLPMVEYLEKNTLVQA
ncbi:MAG: HAMP domain-containing sensor histidine kinase [Ardenticatenaceae bacterium]|nr:HAMP domain-containing sensor histidine kinase [Ardenticatenaceae bacterium]